MKRGYLSDYFEGVAVKRLSAVEADVIRSNQHEFNGVEGLKNILGEPSSKMRFTAKFLYLTDQDDEPIAEDGFLIRALSFRPAGCAVRYQRPVFGLSRHTGKQKFSRISEAKRRQVAAVLRRGLYQTVSGRLRLPETFQVACFYSAQAA
ncbi:hypothetical protein [Neisseria sp.]